MAIEFKFCFLKIVFSFSENNYSTFSKSKYLVDTAVDVDWYTMV